MAVTNKTIVPQAWHGLCILLIIVPILVNAAVKSCACKYCGDVTYCHQMGHNIVPIGLPARNVKRLHLYGNNIKALYGGDFRDMTRLEMLVLNNNSIRSVDVDAFTGLSKLQSLHLEYNEIEFLAESTLRHLTSIKNLFLDHNRLSTFPGDISYLDRLEKLTLDGNNIKSIFWPSFIQLDQIKSLTLWENPLKCDCNTQELARWFATTSSGRAITSTSSTRVCTSKNNCTSPKIVSVEHVRNDDTLTENVYIVNERAVLHCNVTGSPPPLVVWQTKTAGFVYPYKDGRIAAFPNGTLVVSKLAKTDTGTYVCHAQRTASSDSDMMKTILFVTDGVKPQAIPKRSKVETNVGGKIKLSCDVTGLPKPATLWQFVDGEKSFTAKNVTDERMSIQEDPSTLIITKVSEDDSGEWRCVAWNSQGSAFGSIEVKINVSGLNDVTVIIIGACAGMILLVVVAVVAAIAFTMRKRQRRHRNEAKKNGTMKSTHENHAAVVEWTRENDEKRETNREKKEKGEQLTIKKPKRDTRTKNEQDRTERFELPQPYEHQPDVKGFRL